MTDSFAERVHPPARPAVPVAVVHLALAVGAFAIGITEFATMTLLPAFARDLGVDAPTAGHVISAYALGVVVGAPTIGVLTARLPRRALLVGLMLLFALANGLSGLAPSYGWMLAFRFLSGLPHGAYFGIAMLVAAGVVRPDRRTQAVGRVMMGLTVALIVGVPAANLLGQAVGWRWSFALVAALALATAILVRLFAPDTPADPDASPLRELGALRRPQVWLALATGAIGFGGLFSVYSYLAPALAQVTRLTRGEAAIVFALFGIGMTAGSLIVPRFADRALMPTAGAMLLWSAVSLALYPLAAGSGWSVGLDALAIGFGTALAAVMQTRLMDVAGDAQNLAATLNHAAFNLANAIGPLLGGMAIASGWGWTSTGPVGAVLALAGLVVWGASYALDRRRA